MATTLTAKPVKERPQRTRARAIEETRGDKIVLIGITVGLTVILLAVAVPLLHVIAASFSSSDAVVAGRVFLWPIDPTLDAYEAVFNYPHIWRAYGNSIIYTVGATVVSVSLSVLMGFPLSRPGFYGKRFFNLLLVVALLFSGGIVPLYIVVRDLGLLDTRWAMILPGGMAIFSTILARTYFARSVPGELIEQAELDGASDFRILLTIVLPMSKPILAVLALLAAVSNWNSYFSALIYLNDETLYPLQLVLREILVQNQLSASDVGSLSPEQMAEFQNISTLLKYALIIVASLPMLILYPFLQKHFVKGMQLGSLKD